VTTFAVHPRIVVLCTASLVACASACDADMLAIASDAGPTADALDARVPNTPRSLQPGDAEANPDQSHRSNQAGHSSSQPPHADAGAQPHLDPTDSDDAGLPPVPPASSDEDAGTDDHERSAARELLQWVLDALASGNPPTRSEIEHNFTPDGLAAVPADVLILQFMQLSAQLNPFTVGEVRQTSDVSLLAQLDTAIGAVLVDLQISTTTPYQITSLRLLPSSVAPDAPTAFVDAVAQLEPLASKRELLVAEIVDGTCKPLEELNSDTPLAIGSAFKLWVLYALDAKLRDDSSSSWDSKLAIRDELKSVPSGTYQNLTAGTQRSVREFARNMISISDNTAADHLIDFTGRTNVEQAQQQTGHSAPSANIPWLYTREMFALKGWATARQLQTFRTGSVSDKRSVLDELRAEPLAPATLTNWTTPRSLDVEWFADAMDLCQVQRALAARDHFDPHSEVLQILAINPGIGFDLTKWSYVGFKGGSEVGVLSLAWLLQRNDGRWFSIVLIVNDPDHALDENAVIGVGSALPAILAAQSP
jgi:beta-lactamase class A